MTLTVWPCRATFQGGQDVTLAVSADSFDVVVTHLGRTVHTGQSASLGSFPVGGYAVEVRSAGEVAHTAFDVLDSPLDRPRYGFLTDFGATRSEASVRQAVVGMLRNHLNVVQFYDWMYRHATLLADDDAFTDALGRELSHATTRELAKQVRGIGGLPLAYAAVYGAGADYATEHPEQLLYHADGTPWMLADFLWIANLAEGAGWRTHIVAQFVAALDRIGFAGLHLDQYGAPKLARDAAGVWVDLAGQFPDFIGAVRAALPDAALIFNNVNDYPTWATARAPQDATYIEVWSPHDGYGHLARLVDSARGYAPGRPVILAAYLEPFARDRAESAQWAARLALATIFAHGGHALLLGEGDGVLVDPYYPKFARLGAAGAEVLRAYQDFAVANGDLLYDPDAVDVTTSIAGGINDDIELDASVDPVPGRLWVRARRCGGGLVLHLIDLTGQRDLRWNVGKSPSDPVTGALLRIRCPQGTVVLAGSPENGPQLRRVATERDGDYATFAVPAFTGWTVIWLPARPAGTGAAG